MSTRRYLGIYCIQKGHIFAHKEVFSTKNNNKGLVGVVLQRPCTISPIITEICMPNNLFF